MGGGVGALKRRREIGTTQGEGSRNGAQEQRVDLGGWRGGVGGVLGGDYGVPRWRVWGWQKCKTVSGAAREGGCLTIKVE